MNRGFPNLNLNPRKRITKNEEEIVLPKPEAAVEIKIENEKPKKEWEKFVPETLDNYDEWIEGQSEEFKIEFAAYLDKDFAKIKKETALLSWKKFDKENPAKVDGKIVAIAHEKILKQTEENMRVEKEVGEKLIRFRESITLPNNQITADSEMELV